MLYYTMCFFASEEVRSVLILVVLDYALVQLVPNYIPESTVVSILVVLDDALVQYPTTNSKGNKTTKYYFIYKGELIKTSKTVVEKYKLAKQFGANCALVMVINKNSKRIILN